MPTYDYLCGKCDHRFETYQAISAAPLRKCPACGRSALQRLIGTGGGIIFKGSGFYHTDYRSESYKKAAEAESNPPASGNSKDGQPASSGGKSTEPASGGTSASASPAATASSPKAKSGGSAKSSGAHKPQ
jgi:putative FmdB family regulatory protein